MRIGILSWESLHSIPVGGVAVHVSELAAALSRGGDEVHIITRQGPDQSAYAFIDGVHYHRCSHWYRQNFIDDVASMCGAFVDRLFQIEDHSGRFDVIHAHDWLTSKAAVWARQGRGKKVVMTFHSTEYGRCGNYCHEGGSRAIRDYEWEAQYAADRVTAESNALRREVIDMYSTPESKIHTVYNGVQPHRFDGFVDQGQVKQSCGIGLFDPMVLFVGRMAWQKGPDQLLEAVPHLLSVNPQARVVFVGDGDMRLHLEWRAPAMGVGHAVRFLGHRTNQELIDIYRAADIVCVPSRNEPFGIVILEAWSAGKPVVVSQNGGPSEFVWHGVTGLKTPVDIGAIGHAIGSLLKDADYGRWMGHNGRIAVESAFSWDRIAARMRQIYQSVN